MAAVRAEARVAVPYFLLGFLFVMALVPWMSMASPYLVTSAVAGPAICGIGN